MKHLAEQFEFPLVQGELFHDLLPWPPGVSWSIWLPVFVLWSKVQLIEIRPAVFSYAVKSASLVISSTCRGQVVTVREHAGRVLQSGHAYGPGDGHCQALVDFDGSTAWYYWEDLG